MLNKSLHLQPAFSVLQSTVSDDTSPAAWQHSTLIPRPSLHSRWTQAKPPLWPADLSGFKTLCCLGFQAGVNPQPLRASPSAFPSETASVPSARGSHLHQLVALLAADNEVVTELVLRLQVLDDGELVQRLGLGALDDCEGDQKAWLVQSCLSFLPPPHPGAPGKLTFAGVAQLPASAIPRLVCEE